MHPELITKKELGYLLTMSPTSARKLCERNGVYPINVGNGKVPRLRWQYFAVMKLLDTMASQTFAKQPDTRKSRIRRKKSESIPIFSMPVNDIISIIQ